MKQRPRVNGNDGVGGYYAFIGRVNLLIDIYQLKICENGVMFWTLCPRQGVYYPTIIPLVMPTTTNKDNPQSLPSSKPQVMEQPQRIKTPILNITQRDLLKAGYENRKRPWSEEEDEKLKHLREVEKLDWPDISEQLMGRNPKMCYNRYRRLENHTKNLWKRTENEMICSLVAQFGENWKQISKHFQARTQKQIKEHYINFLRPNIKKDDWTLQEDLKLVRLMNMYGKNWKYLEQNFEGRTQNQIKNRYFGRLKKINEKKNIPDQQSQDNSPQQ